MTQPTTRCPTLLLALGLCALLPVLSPGPAAAQDVFFGDDSGRWARDGECDDRRFVGPGMASVLLWMNAGRDATDCRRAFEAGTIRFWDWSHALQATRCSRIDFGNDSGEWANDGECDDMRFEGPGMASGVISHNIGKDASDCRHYCEFGIIVLREYFE